MTSRFPDLSLREEHPENPSVGTRPLGGAVPPTDVAAWKKVPTLPFNPFTYVPRLGEWVGPVCDESGRPHILCSPTECSYSRNSWREFGECPHYKFLGKPKKPRKDFSPTTRRKILIRDKYTCQLCGAKAPKAEIVVDHIIPCARGGTGRMSNGRACCVPCNSSKRAKHDHEL